MPLALLAAVVLLIAINGDVSVAIATCAFAVAAMAASMNPVYATVTQNSVLFINVPQFQFSINFWIMLPKGSFHQK